MKPDSEPNTFNYNGPSMKPLLKPGDGLHVDPGISYGSLRKGDVICFKSPDKPIHVTHRIVAVTPGGLITRGDNNRQHDPSPITPEHEPRRLTHIRRGGRTIKIHGGKTGMLVHRKNLIQAFFMRHVIFTLIRVADWFAANRFKKIIQITLPNESFSIHQFKRGGKTMKMLMYRNRKIAYTKADGRWHVRFPWRLLINTEKIASGG